MGDLISLDVEHPVFTHSKVGGVFEHCLTSFLFKKLGLYHQLEKMVPQMIHEFVLPYLVEVKPFFGALNGSMYRLQVLEPRVQLCKVAALVEPTRLDKSYRHDATLLILL